MARTGIKISNDLLTLDRRLRRRVEVARQGVANLLEVNIKGQIREVGAVASQALVNSIERKPARGNVVSVGTDKEYAPDIEEGRKPGPVPPWSQFKGILRAWAAAKGLRFSDSALYAIARKISREGFKGRFPFRRAKEITEPQAVRLIKNQLRGL